MLAQGLALAARASPFVNSIQPWRFPPQLTGCSQPDVLASQSAVLPVLQCMNVNVSSIASAFATAQANSNGKMVGPHA